MNLILKKREMKKSNKADDIDSCSSKDSPAKRLMKTTISCPPAVTPDRYEKSLIKRNTFNSSKTTTDSMLKTSNSSSFVSHFNDKSSIIGQEKRKSVHYMRPKYQRLRTVF